MTAKVVVFRLLSWYFPKQALPVQATDSNEKGLLHGAVFFMQAVPLLLFSFDADAKPLGKSVFDDDPGVGWRAGDDDDINGDDVNGP